MAAFSCRGYREGLPLPPRKRAQQAPQLRPGGLFSLFLKRAGNCDPTDPIPSGRGKLRPQLRPQLRPHPVIATPPPGSSSARGHPAA